MWFENHRLDWFGHLCVTCWPAGVWGMVHLSQHSRAAWDAAKRRQAGQSAEELMDFVFHDMDMSRKFRNTAVWSEVKPNEIGTGEAQGLEELASEWEPTVTWGQGLRASSFPGDFAIK